MLIQLLLIFSSKKKKKKLWKWEWNYRACVSRFKDCPLCGADIEKIEDNENLQSLVDRFIEGHARIKRPHMDGGGENEEETEKVETQNDKRVIYEDVSLERGAFLVQQAMRVSFCFPPFCILFLFLTFLFQFF